MTNSNNFHHKTIGISNASKRPFDRALIKHVCLDVIVCGRSDVGRPWLTIILDDYSKRVCKKTLKNP